MYEYILEVRGEKKKQDTHTDVFATKWLLQLTVTDRFQEKGLNPYSGRKLYSCSPVMCSAQMRLCMIIEIQRTWCNGQTMATTLAT